MNYETSLFILKVASLKMITRIKIGHIIIGLAVGLLILLFASSSTIAAQTDDTIVGFKTPENDEELIEAVEYWKDKPNFPDDIKVIKQNLEEMEGWEIGLLQGMLRQNGYYLDVTEQPDVATIFALAQFSVDGELKTTLALDNNQDVRGKAEQFLRSWATFITGAKSSLSIPAVSAYTKSFSTAEIILNDNSEARFDNAFPDLKEIQSNPSTRKATFEKTIALRTYGEEQIQFLTNLWAREYGSDMVPDEYSDLIITDRDLFVQKWKWWIFGISAGLTIGIVSFGRKNIWSAFKAGLTTNRGFIALITVVLVVGGTLIYFSNLLYFQDANTAKQNEAYRKTKAEDRKRDEAQRQLYEQQKQRERQQQELQQSIDEAQQRIDSIQPLIPNSQ